MQKILILLSVVVLFYSCGASTDDKKSQLEKLKKEQEDLSKKIKTLEDEIAKTDTSKKAKMLDVEVAPVAVQPFKSYVEIQGKLDADQNVTISALMAGTIKSIYVTEGDAVKAGQILAEVDDAVLRQSVSQMQSQLAFATDLYNKQKNLWDQKIGSEVQYLTAKNQKESLEKQLQTMNEQLELYKIKSPINGTIDEVMLKLGQTAAPGFPAIRVVNMGSLKVKADVSENYASKIRVGNSVIVKFPDAGKELDAKVSFVSKVISAMNRTFNVQVSVPTDADLHPNMIAKMMVVDYESPHAIVIPLNTVQNSTEGNFVFVAEKNDKGQSVAHKRIVSAGRDYDGQVEILDGLKEGDTIITVGFQDLEDGELIKI